MNKIQNIIEFIQLQQVATQKGLKIVFDDIINGLCIVDGYQFTKVDSIGHLYDIIRKY